MNNDLAFDIANKLQNQTKLQIQLLTIDKQKFQLTVGKTALCVLLKPNLLAANLGAAISEMLEYEKEFRLKGIIFSNYISGTLAEKLKAENICYADASGNVHIKTDEVFVLIQGLKKDKPIVNAPSRLFRDAGIKLIFCLLNKPGDINLPYRTLAQKAGIALGSVSVLMQALETENFVLKTEKSLHLKHLPELLNRWIVAYNAELRPKLFKKRMRFANSSQYKNWQTLKLQLTNQAIFWGAEPAAALLTQHLKPGVFTIYTTAAWHELMPVFGLVPDMQGDVEILQCFFETSDLSIEKQTVSPVLVYADLINTGNSRNIETAKIILQNELSYIK